MFLLVVMCWKTPDEGVVMLTDVGVHLLQRVDPSSLVIRKKNLVRNHLGVSVLQSDINRGVDALEVSHKPVV